MTTSSRWADLPVELYVQILSLLKPHEIARMRMVCKRLRDITYERVVWLNALYLVRKEGNSTYPVPLSRATSVSELESAATAPFRFTARLHETAVHDDCLVPTRTRTLMAKDIIPNNAAGDNTPILRFSHIDLVLGGRYLITISGEVLLHIWDLSNISGPSTKPIATLRGPEPAKYDSVRSAVASATEDKVVMLIAVRIHDSNTPLYGTMCYKLYRVTLHEIDTVEFHVDIHDIGKIAVDDNLTLYHIDAYHGYLLMRDSETLMIWNYVQDKVACMDVRSEAVLLRGDHLVCWNGHTLLLYELPPMSLHSDEPPECLMDYEPVFVYRSPTWVAALSVGSLSWDSDEDQVHLDVFGANDIKNPRILSYSFPIPTSQTTRPQSTLSLEPVLIGDMEDLERIADSYTGPFTRWIPNHTKVVLWIDPDERLNLKFLTGDSDALAPSVIIWESAMEEAIADTELISTCTRNARLCVVTGQSWREDLRRKQGSEIQVVDFA